MTDLPGNRTHGTGILVVIKLPGKYLTTRQHGLDMVRQQDCRPWCISFPKNKSPVIIRPGRPERAVHDQVLEVEFIREHHAPASVAPFD
jgi:hypothetical protein